jgi:hypothetical protein
MLKLGRATADRSKNRAERLKKCTIEYLSLARSLSSKLANVSELNPNDLGVNVI